MKPSIMKYWVAILLLAGTLASARTNEVARAITLRECITQALANNLEIHVQKLQPPIAQWGIVRQEAAFEPALTGSIGYEENEEPAATGQTVSRSVRPRIGVGGFLPTGTRYSLSLADNATAGTGYRGFDYIGTLTLSLSQPLLRNFGTVPNTAALRVARRHRAIALENFRGLVMDKVTEVSAAYHELVFTIENHKAKVEDLARARRLLEENRKRVEVGVLSALDITQAEAGVAEREEAVLVAERLIRETENALKRLISTDVREWLETTLVPADLPLAEAVAIDAVASTRAALANRPDYRALQEELQRRNILVAYNRNQLWPQVDLQTSFALNGQSDDTIGRLTRNQAGGEHVRWGIGIVVTFPLGNREARANYQSAKLEAQTALLNLKRLEQNIVVAVDNAIGRVRTNWKRIEATRAASRLAEESLKAEESKLRAGTSTSFLVLQAQSQLANARSAAIRAKADYSQSLVELARVEGTTLEKNQIELEEP